MKTKFIFLGLLVVLFACDNNNNPFVYQKDAHGRGKTTIQVEESFKPLFTTCIETFMSQYPKATIKGVYGPEDQLIANFYANKTKTIVISRDLNDQEKQYLKSKNVSYRSDKVATDAVTLILHPSMTDTLLSVAQIKALLSSDQAKLPSGKNIEHIVFDQRGSANFNFMVNMLQIQNLAKRVSAVNSNEEVINYVKTHPNSIGIIGLNWVSDQDDPEALNFLDGLRIADVYTDDPEAACKPYAGFIYTKEYPLIRDIWMINKGRRSGLNTGFVLFMKKDDKGQLIIQKSELVPALTPVRLVLQ
ncbi:MAG: PstS family phosphate ABC transporter substrate-binding protein [Flavobacteriales bacterium]